MADHDKYFEEQNSKLRCLADRLDFYENYEGEALGDEDYHYDDQEMSQNQTQTVSIDSDSSKRKLESTHSRFESMNKKFKAAEICDKDVDSTLASNINELFRLGMDESRYQELITGDTNARPSNCESLVVVQTNPLIWDAVLATARSSDKKMQNIEASVVKASTIMVKAVSRMAKMEEFLKEQCGDADDTFCQDFGTTLDECNNALALMGHCNRQINLARKDFFRPQLNKEYSHLCNHNRPYTSFLFGDDVSKDAREIEDCSKISNKIITNRPPRGTFNYRRIGRGPRFTRGRGRFVGNEPHTSTSTVTHQTKNYQRQGSRPFYRQ